MPIIGATQFLERIQFFNGERLFASDLQGLEAFNREMRWLHNQSLHQVGVASGFAVLGNAGDRQVAVSVGYAIDSCGREIILTETQVLQIPPVADNGSGGSVFYDLTVAYPDDSELTPSETRTGICTTPGVVRLREAPVFCWVRLGDDPNRQPVDQTLKDRIKAGLFLILARIEVFNCQLRQPVSTVQRRNARPPRQPRIACGVETQSTWSDPILLNQQSGDTASSSGGALGSLMYVREVDTKSARFESTPVYDARLSGTRLPVVNRVQVFIDALTSISKVAPTTFELQVFPFAIGEGIETDDVTAAVHKWDVAWIGVEG